MIKARIKADDKQQKEEFHEKPREKKKKRKRQKRKMENKNLYLHSLFTREKEREGTKEKRGTSDFPGSRESRLQGHS